MITKPEKIEYMLPHNVLLYIKKHFADAIIIDMEVMKRANGSINYYKVDVVEGDDTHYLRFDKRCGFLNDDIEIGEQEEEEPFVHAEDEEVDEY